MTYATGDAEFSELAVDLAFTCECLGCIMEAHRTGALSDDEYQAVFDLQQEMGMRTAPCPTCGAPAYISLYEPDVMHCPACGLYSQREGDNGSWQPLRQGITLERQEAREGAREENT